MHPVGFEPTMCFTNRIMSPVQSTTLPWMLKNILNQTNSTFYLYMHKKKSCAVKKICLIAIYPLLSSRTSHLVAM